MPITRSKRVEVVSWLRRRFCLVADEAPRRSGVLVELLTYCALLDKCSDAYVTKHDTVVNVIRTPNLTKTLRGKFVTRKTAV